MPVKLDTNNGRSNSQQEGQEAEPQSVRHSTLKLVIFTLVLFILVLLVFIYAAIGLVKTWDWIKTDALQIAFHALVTASVGGILIHQILKRDELNEIKQAVRNAVLFNSEAIKQLALSEKTATVERFVNSIVPGTHGELLFKAMVAPYLNRYGIRTKFRYDVSFSLEEKVFGQEAAEQILFARSQYHWVNVDYLYATSYDQFPSTMQLAFIADEERLEKSIGDRELVFREGMLLKPSAWDRIGNLSNSALKKFVIEFMKLNLFINNEKAQLRNIIPLKPSASGFVAEFDSPSFVRGNNDKEIEICIKFGMPYRRSVQRYLVTLPYPTYEPEINFFRHVEQQDLAAITFMTRHEKVGELSNKELTGGKGRQVQLKNNCAFPRSGAMFVWNDPEFHKQALDN